MGYSEDDAVHKKEQNKTKQTKKKQNKKQNKINS